MKLNIGYLHKKRKAGGYQDRYIFETYSKGSSKGPGWEISAWPFWLYHKFTLWSWENPLLLPRPQLLVLENGGGVGKREHEGFSPFIGQRRKRRETDRSMYWSPQSSPPPHLISHLCPTFFCIWVFLKPCLSPPYSRQWRRKIRDAETQNPLSCFRQKLGGKKNLDLMAEMCFRVVVNCSDGGCLLLLSSTVMENGVLAWCISQGLWHLKWSTLGHLKKSEVEVLYVGDPLYRSKDLHDTSGLCPTQSASDLTRYWHSLY